MSARLSPRLLRVVDALPLEPGLRVVEFGCGPGAMAREIAARIGDGHVLGVDRSAKAIAQAEAACRDGIVAGRLSFRLGAVEDFGLEPGEQAYDVAVAVRVGALDGRHPELEARALGRIAEALSTDGRLFVDREDRLEEVRLTRRRRP